MPNLIVTRGFGSNQRIPMRGYGGAIVTAVRRIVGRGPTARRSQQYRNPDPVAPEHRKIDEFVTIAAELFEMNDELSNHNVKGSVKLTLSEISSRAHVMSEHVSTRINRALTDIVIYVKRVKRKTNNGGRR